MSLSTVAAVVGALSIKFWPFQGAHTVTSPSPYVCNLHYTPEILSTEPLMIYLNDFLSLYEINHLLSLNSNWTYAPNITDPEEKPRQRTSGYIIVEDQPDEVTNCIVRRADTLVGFIPSEGLELLQIGRTQPGEQHPLHWDYLQEPELNSAGKLCNRAASFFIFLSDVAEGGETYFPYLDGPPAEVPVDERKFRRPKRKGSVGMMLRPVKGSGLFWMNVYQNGTLEERSRHAGMMVKRGTKYGLNILVEQCV
ncbi:hypothetical protein MMC34_006537 [Xylographa carneopallida]|nr:hypothetical protein [Xylographa carneopallida]